MFVGGSINSHLSTELLFYAMQIIFTWVALTEYIDTPQNPQEK